MKWHDLAFLLALILYSITAYNSLGYYHADEHYQIIEFAGHKLGTHTANELPWEFKDQIRPALQPTICYFVFLAFEQLNITDPYDLSFLLRLFTALLALIITRFFVNKTLPLFETPTQKIAYIALSYFLWFIPVISVRFSSETWSGLFLMLALGIYFQKNESVKKSFLLGLILGLSFLFRYQMALVIGSLLIWMLFVQKSNLKYGMGIALGLGSMLFAGLLVDSWFYETWVFTPWNYFYFNIIKDVASKFGTEPWYYYLYESISSMSYIIGIPVFLAFISLVILKPKNILVWIIFPFILFHSIIPHKELRFIFPLVTSRLLI